MPVDDIIRAKTEAFCADLVTLVRAAITETITRALALPSRSKPKPKQPKPLNLVVRKRLPGDRIDLTAAEDRTLGALRAATRPLSSWDMAGKLSRSESTVRYQLGRLVQKGAARRQEENGRVRYVVA